MDWLLRVLIIAQENMGGAAPSGATAPAAEAAKGAAQSQSPMGPCGGGDPMFLVMMVALFALMYFMLIRPQKKQQEAHKKLISSLKKGDRIVTSGGLMGTIVGLTENIVHVEVMDGVKIKIQRQHVSGLQVEPGAK